MCGPRQRLGTLVLALWLTAGCAAPAPPSSAPPPAAPAASAPAAGAPAASTPTLATLPPLPSPVKVRAATLSNLPDAPVYIALERGYFAELGLDVEDTRFDSAARMLVPLAANQLDVVSGALAAGLYNAFARDIDVRVVADRVTLAPGHGYQALVVRQDLWESGAVRTLADLPGRKAGISGHKAGSQFARTLGRALEERGLSLADLDLVDLPPAEINMAMTNQSLDAGIQLEPLLALGLAGGLFSVMHGADALYPDQQVGLILYSAEFARTQAEAARRWMVAYLRGVRAYHDAFFKNLGYDDVVAILVRQTPVKDPALYRQMTAHYVNPTGRLNVNAMIDDQDWYAANGFVPQKVDVAALIDYQYVDYALSVLGP